MGVSERMLRIIERVGILVALTFDGDQNETQNANFNRSHIGKYVPQNFVPYTVEPVYYGHLGTNQRCPDYQGVLIFQVSLYDKAPFGTIARCPDYAGVHIFKCPD